MQTKKSISIVGSQGNVGLSLWNGLLNKSNHYGPENIFGVTRDYSLLPEAYTKKIRVHDVVFISVKPTDAVKTLDGLRGDLKEDVTIISCVSGLGVNILSEMLNVRHDQIIKLTLNINIEYGNGVVIHRTPGKLIQTFEEIFNPLCLKTIPKRSKKILDAVVYDGSGDGMVAQYIWLRLKERNDVPFSVALNELTMDDPGVKNYIRVMKKTCMNLFYNDVYDAIFFQSTLDTIKVSCLSLDDIKLHIERVATKGGCTAVAVGDFDSLEKVNEYFFTESFRKILNKARSFQWIIQKDFNEWKKNQRKINSEYSFPQKLW